MFSKRALLIGLVLTTLMVLPSLTYGQGEWLRHWTWTPERQLYGFDTGDEWAEKLFPTTQDSFIVDSVGFWTGRAVGTEPWEFDFRILIYEDDGTVTSTTCPGGAVVCDAMGTQKYTGDYNTATDGNWDSMEVGFVYYSPFALAAPCTLYRDFIVVIQNLEHGGSWVMNGEDNIPCCTNFYHLLPTAWEEHWDLWNRIIPTWLPRDVGYNMIDAFGRYTGPSQGGQLELCSDSLWFGHALADGHQLELAEVVYDTVEMENTGGSSLTINTIASTLPFNFWWPIDPTPLVLPSGGTYALGVGCSTNVTASVTSADLTFTHDGVGGTEMVELNLQGTDNHWLENFCDPNFPDPYLEDSGDWGIAWPLDSLGQVMGCTLSTDNDFWHRWYNNCDYANDAMGHLYTAPGCTAMDFLVTPNISNTGGGLKVKWADRTHYGWLAVDHSLWYSSPNDTLIRWVADIPISGSNSFTDVDYYFVNSDSDSISLWFYYEGADADFWLIDDIRVDSMEQAPPVILHEHKSDTFNASVHITATVTDVNDDLSSVVLWYADDVTHTWNSVAMTAVPGCVDLYEGTIPNVEACNKYGYYFEAQDIAASGPTYLPAGAPGDHYHVDIMGPYPGSIVYDDGIIEVGSYFPGAWWARFGVRFVNPDYPSSYFLGAAMVGVSNMLGDPPDYWPNDIHEDIVVEVYNEFAGEPGNLLWSSDDVGTSWNLGTDACNDTGSWYWVYAKIPNCVEITDSVFYIFTRNRDNSEDPEMEAFIFDTLTTGPQRGWLGWPLETPGTIDWVIDDSTGYGDQMLRALDCSCVPVELVDVTCYSYDTDGTQDTVMIHWTDVGNQPYYHVYAEADSPYTGTYNYLGSVAMGTQEYYDGTSGDAKKFYHVTGGCEATPSLIIPVEPPTSPPTVVNYHNTGPLKELLSDMRIDQQWPTTSPAFKVDDGRKVKTFLKSDLIPTAKKEIPSDLIDTPDSPETRSTSIKTKAKIQTLKKIER